MHKLDKQLDNPIDNMFRVMCEQTVHLFRYFMMTPNFITTLSLISGGLSAYMYSANKLVPAILLFVTAYYLDCMDGYYARKYDMCTVFGELYDHGSDILKHALLLYAMYKKSHKKFFKVLPLLLFFTLASFVHLGCQEKHYEQQANTSEDQQILISSTKMLCPDHDYIKYTRFFGCGTLILVFVASMIYLN